MTLREAIDAMQGWQDEIESGAIHVATSVKARTLEAFRLVIEAAKLQADDTVEIVTLTEGVK